MSQVDDEGYEVPIQPQNTGMYLSLLIKTRC